jgi:acyl-CoA reductase-like NAD-dependent aldehyde dehydrogenase
METIENIAEEMVDLWYTNDVGDGNRVQRAERRKLAERIAEALQEERERCARIAEEYGRTVGDSVARKIREGGA